MRERERERERVQDILSASQFCNFIKRGYVDVSQHVCYQTSEQLASPSAVCHPCTLTPYHTNTHLCSKAKLYWPVEWRRQPDQGMSRYWLYFTRQYNLVWLQWRGWNRERGGTGNKTPSYYKCFSSSIPIHNASYSPVILAKCVVAVSLPNEWQTCVSVCVCWEMPVTAVLLYHAVLGCMLCCHSFAVVS